MKNRLSKTANEINKAVWVIKDKDGNIAKLINGKKAKFRSKPLAEKYLKELNKSLDGYTLERDNQWRDPFR